MGDGNTAGGDWHVLVRDRELRLPGEELMTSVEKEPKRSDRVRFRMVLLGPVLTYLTYLVAPQDLSPEALGTLLAAVWTVTWWITEAIPIPAASLLPAVLLPLFGVCDAQVAAKYYSHHLILLLLGGFLLARAVECSGLHKRIALATLTTVGTSPRLLAVGFLCTAAMLSMWISNTATTLMLMPIAISVAMRTEKDIETSKGVFTTCLLLCTAYGANVGGIGTLIGTPPNLIFVKNAGDLDPPVVIDFLRWLTMGMPVVVIFVPLVGLLMTRFLLPLPSGSAEKERETLLLERKGLGKISSGETRVLLVFLVTALLWITRGGGGIPGWSGPVADLMGIPAHQINDYLKDSIVAITAAITLFMIPSRRGGPPLLNWDQAKDVPWGMLLLFGGGFALGGSFQSSGLSEYCGSLMARWVDLPFPALVFSISLATTFLTEVTSNTASMHLLMPILSSAAIQGGIPPLHMMIPAVLSVSCAFMLPVATAPNAIVFATGRVKIKTMLKCGFVLNLIGAVVVLIVTLLIRALEWMPGG